MLPVETPFKTYTDLCGKPLDNGFVYFGEPDQNPVTSPIEVYWDADGTIPAAQPLRTVNGYIMRAGTPANVFANVAYSELVQDAKKRQVFYSRTSDEFSIATAIANFFTSTSAFFSGLAASGGAALVGFVQTGAGAIKLTLETMLRGTIDPRQFGAVLDGVTDDTAAMQRAINCRGFDRSVAIRLPSGYPAMKIAGKLYLPSLVTIDLNGCLLYGNGTNTMFATGCWRDGSVVSNQTQADGSPMPNETAIVYSSAVFNGGINNCERGFDLFNFCEGSRIEDIRMTGVNQAYFANRCFYPHFHRIMVRAPLNGALYPCFHHHDAVNAVGLEQVYCTGYSIGWKISGSKDNFSAFNCGSEGNSIGVQIDDATFGMKFDTWYLENNASTALSFSSGGNHQNVDVRGCFFNGTPTAISGTTIVSGVFHRTNKLGTSLVDLATNFSNQLRVEIPTDVTATNAVPALPSNYSLGDSVTVDYVKTLHGTDGLTTAKGAVEGGIIPLHYSGDSGRAQTGVVPFCVGTLTDTSLTIDTQINYRDGAFVGIQLNIAASGTQSIVGIYAAGLALNLIKPGSVTVDATNNGGFYRFTVTGLVSATAYSGTARIL